MKKRLILIFATLAALCGIFAISACDKHTHEFGEWSVTTEATCSAAGEERRSCECGVYETRPIAKLDHTAEDVAGKDATCEEAGLTAGKKCSVCNAVIEEQTEIPALGHSWGDWTEVPSTCSVAGHKTRTCERCQTPETEPLPLAEHTIVAAGEAKDATCEEEGLTAGKKCSVCHTVIEAQTAIPALGHDLTYAFWKEEAGASDEPDCRHTATCNRADCDFTEEQVCTLSSEVTPATCTEPEHHTHTCKYCEHVYAHEVGEPLGHSESYSHWVFDEETYERSLAAGGEVIRRHIRICANHPFNEETDAEDCGEGTRGETHAPACGVGGYTDFSCDTCGAEWTGEGTAPLEHSWTLCEQYMHPSLGRLCHRRKCETCGAYYSNSFMCNITTETTLPTCTEAGRTVATCKDCHGVYVLDEKEPLGHIYTAWKHDDSQTEENRHYKVCERADCGDVQVEACVMETARDLPTCQSVGQEVTACKDCFYTADSKVLEQLQHRYADADAYTPDGNHKTHTRVCELCHTPEVSECVYSVERTEEATCTTAEIRHFRCSVCGDGYSEENTKAFGHTVSSWTISADGTKHEGDCDRCRNHISSAHDFEESNLCAICGQDGLTYEYIKESGRTKAYVSSDSMPGSTGGAYAPALPSKTVVIADYWNGVPVTEIGVTAFNGNTNIEKLVLPRHLEIIGYSAFDGCSNLQDVRLMGHDYGETGIEDVKLRRIEGRAFNRCVSLTRTIFPETLEYIGMEAFKGCAVLDDINIPVRVTEIDADAFTGTAFFADPANWEGGALYINAHLVKADVSAQGTFTIRSGVVSVSEKAFENCKGITSVVIPAGVAVFDKDAFLGCDGLLSVVYHGTFKEYLAISFLSDTASPMYYAKELTIDGATGVIEIPENATSIPAGAFRGSKVTGVIIHGKVASIGAQAFMDCKDLEYIFIEGEKLSEVGADAFKGTKFYQTPGNWEDGVLYLKNKNGTMPLDSEAEEPSLSENKYLAVVAADAETVGAELTVHEGVRVIAGGVFRGCADLKRVVLPATLVYIGAYAFGDCGVTQIKFTTTGGHWFASAVNMARLLSDTYLQTGETVAAGAFKLYVKEWKRQ